MQAGFAMLEIGSVQDKNIRCGGCAFAVCFGPLTMRRAFVQDDSVEEYGMHVCARVCARACVCLCVPARARLIQGVALVVVQSDFSLGVLGFWLLGFPVEHARAPGDGDGWFIGGTQGWFISGTTDMSVSQRWSWRGAGCCGAFA